MLLIYIRISYYQSRDRFIFVVKYIMKHTGKGAIYMYVYNIVGKNWQGEIGKLTPINFRKKN